MDKLTARVASVERKVDRILIGIAVSVVIIGLFGWLLSPFIEAVADRIVVITDTTSTDSTSQQPTSN